MLEVVALLAGSWLGLVGGFVITVIPLVIDMMILLMLLQHDLNIHFPCCSLQKHVLWA